MKKIYEKLIYVLFLSLILFSTTFLKGYSQTPENREKFPNECTLDWGHETIEDVKWKVMRDEFNQKFKYKNGRTYKSKARIKMSHLIKLLKAAEDLMDKDPACINENCLSAFKIYLGCKGKDIKYIFSPGYLKVTYKDPLTKVIHLNNFERGNFYQYKEKKGFKKVDKEDQTDYSKKYRDKTKKEQKPLNYLDTKSITYSFQVLFEFYNNLFDPGNSGKVDYNHNLDVYNASVDTLINSQVESKHSVFFKLEKKAAVASRKKLIEDGFSADLHSVKMSYAVDYANLCPPKCVEGGIHEYLEFKLE